MAATLPMLALVWLRGRVGVDLPVYVQTIEEIRDLGIDFNVFEPGFAVLIFALGHLSSDPIILLNLIATTTTLLILGAEWRTNTAYQVIGLAIIPYFYLDMTMNGLRYGLAFAIVLVSLNSLIKKQQLRYSLLTVLGSSMHVSSFYLFSSLQFLCKLNLKYLLIAIGTIFGVTIIFLDYFSIKFLSYADFSKPGITSGVAPLLLSALALVGCKSVCLINRFYRLQLWILFALTIIAYGAAQFSYAGLRFQQMNYLLILLFLIYVSEKSGLKQSKVILTTLILAFVLGSVFRLNNFQSEAGVGEAPFAPYKFYWSE